MKLIPIVRLNPLRNEKMEIYKWEPGVRELVNPMKVSRLRYEVAVDRVLLRLDNGDEFIIDDTVESFQHAFNEATT